MSRAVVFDLDGTLVDSLPFVMEAFSHALAPYLDQPLTLERFAHFGGPPDRLFPQLVREEAQAAAALERLAAYNAQYGYRPALFPGARGLLQSLQARGVALALWTGRDRTSAEAILQYHQLAPFFGAIVCGDDLGTHKPDPEGLQTILERLAVTPEATLFLGDADVDVLAGRACGVATVLIGHGRVAPPLVRQGAWREVPRTDEGYGVVAEWAGLS